MTLPSDFYFQLCSGDNEDSENGISEDPYFLITPRTYFDSSGCLDDECSEDNTPLPDGFASLMEATFEYDGDPQHGRNLLIQAGFVEKKMF